MPRESDFQIYKLSKWLKYYMKQCSQDARAYWSAKRVIKCSMNLEERETCKFSVKVSSRNQMHKWPLNGHLKVPRSKSSLIIWLIIQTYPERSAVKLYRDNFRNESRSDFVTKKLIEKGFKIFLLQLNEGVTVFFSHERVIYRHNHELEGRFWKCALRN